MKKAFAVCIFLGGVHAAMGCGFAARTPSEYAMDTEALLHAKDTEIRDCYNEVLRITPALYGIVVVNFVLESKTGRLVNPEVDPTTSAPDEVTDCVLRELNGLTLVPPDGKAGHATAAWDFHSTEPAPSPSPAE